MQRDDTLHTLKASKLYIYTIRVAKTKGADQLRGYREADLRLCFRLGRLLVFSRGSSIHAEPPAKEPWPLGQELEIHRRSTITLYQFSLMCSGSFECAGKHMLCYEQ